MRAWMIGIFVALGTSSMGLTLEELKTKFPDRFFATLNTPSGTIHYQDVGPKTGQVVVLVHGVSGPLSAWDKTVPFLANAGFRVVRLDLFGRGFSQRLEKNTYSLDLYVQEVKELLGALNVLSPVRLVGSSFGAVVVSEFALRNPGRVESIVLIGPAGFPIKVPAIAKIGDLPFLGQIFFNLFGKSVIRKQNKKYFVDEKPPKEFWDYFTTQLDVPGTAEAMRATMKNAPVQDYVDSYKRLGKTMIPVRVIWGREDATFPYSNHTTLLNAIPRAKLVTIENSAHLPQYERSEETNRALLEEL